MLVCNVSLRPPRRAISSELAEAATAVDSTATGFVVFATLVDDPASVNEIVDAYLGEIMLEAASASDTITAGSAYAATIIETVGASSTQDGQIPAVSFTTWNPADNNATTLSNANLTAASITNQAGVRAVKGQSSGKYYFELSAITSTQGGDGYGLATATANLNMNVATGAGAIVDGFQIVRVNGTLPLGSGSIDGSLGTCAVAVDLDAAKVWFKLGGGTWNGSGSNNPATGVGGASISSLTFPLFPYVRMADLSETVTANFGASTFSGTVPAGFTAGWPAT